MKHALERFSVDRESESTHPQGQGQLAADRQPTAPRPSFSEQIRASFIRPGDALCHPSARQVVSRSSSGPGRYVTAPTRILAAGLPNNEVFAKANYPEAGSGLMSQSVGEAPSMAAQTAAGLLQRYHVLNTNDVSGLLMTQAIPRQTDAGTVKASRPANIILPEHKDGVGKLPPHLGSGSDHSSHTITAHRGKSIPADAIQRSSLYTPPVKVLTPSAAVQLAQEAESLSRRASLAAKLHRMAESADARSARASESSDGVSIKASLHASQASSPAHITSSSDGYQGKSMPLVAEQYLPKQRTSLDKVSRADAGQGADPSAEQTSNAVNSKAAGVRRLHLTSSNNREKSGYSKPLSGMTSEDSIQHSNKDLHVAGAQAAEGSGMQAGQAPVLRRTLSDAAAEALDVVESVQCPIIPYTQLQIQRKIGDGSIGQVCACPFWG